MDVSILIDVLDASIEAFKAASGAALCAFVHWVLLIGWVCLFNLVNEV